MAKQKMSRELSKQRLFHTCLDGAAVQVSRRADKVPTGTYCTLVKVQILVYRHQSSYMSLFQNMNSLNSKDMNAKFRKPFIAKICDVLL